MACALGLVADDDLRELSAAIRLGIRCDRPGTILVDYHTVVGGVMSAEGKIKITATTHQPETVVSRRRYIADGSFLAAVRAPPDWIARLADAVQRPHWPVYLGRKCCPPSRPVFEGTADYPSLEVALATWPAALDASDEPTRRLRAVLECPAGQGVLRRDEIDSRSRRTFGPRYSRDVLLDLIPGAKEVSQ
jgi:CRISPR system Cascade subunit CasD